MLARVRGETPGGIEMIGDLCKPLNPGESRTVRLVMTVDEARELLLHLMEALDPKTITEPPIRSLLRILQRCIEENWRARDSCSEDLDRVTGERPDRHEDPAKRG